MAKLAIQGHATRGKEVIGLLEMIGGINRFEREGINEDWFYYIDKNNYIQYTCGAISYYLITLEEFLKKFPYKVGDKVIIKSNNQEAIVTEVTWDYDTIMYRLKQNDDFLCKYIAYELQPYKEEVMEEELIPKIDFSKYSKNKYLLDMGDYEIKFKDGKTYVVRKKTQYPKTYLECCQILSIYDASNNITGYQMNLINRFRKLLICRDAYWKIAGEELGLDKPWEPDWTNNHQKKWITNFYQSEINFTTGPNVQFILAFPTVEMRDDFYKNFKELIEQCRELL